MAKEKAVTPQPEAPKLIKGVVAIGEAEAYRGDMRDSKKNVIKTFLFYDPDLVQSREQRMELKAVREKTDAFHAKPGDVIELPLDEFLFLEGPGAVKRV